MRGFIGPSLKRPNAGAQRRAEPAGRGPSAGTPCWATMFSWSQAGVLFDVTVKTQLWILLSKGTQERRHPVAGPELRIKAENSLVARPERQVVFRCGLVATSRDFRFKRGS